MQIVLCSDYALSSFSHAHPSFPRYPRADLDFWAIFGLDLPIANFRGGGPPPEFRLKQALLRDTPYPHESLLATFWGVFWPILPQNPLGKVAEAKIPESGPGILGLRDLGGQGGLWGGLAGASLGLGPRIWPGGGFSGILADFRKMSENTTQTTYLTPT